MPIAVSTDNFVRAETNRMMNDLQREAGGINRLVHRREPASIDKQTVIRLNRDTLYSFAVVDISEGATLFIPEHGDRYVSAMVVNQDHYINAVFHSPGEHTLTLEQHGTPYVTLGIRILVDPENPDDIAAVTRLQDQIVLRSDSAVPFQSPDYDETSFTDVRNGLLSLATHLTAFDQMFGRADQVDPVRHLLGTAAGWGGLPTTEASYFGVAPDGAAGRYELHIAQVPVDGFWSVSVYNAAGFFEPNAASAYTLNNITAARDDDGSITIRFGDWPNGTANTLPIQGEGWNYLVRMYRPRAEILDGSWAFPSAVPVHGEPTA